MPTKGPKFRQGVGKLMPAGLALTSGSFHQFPPSARLRPPSQYPLSLFSPWLSQLMQSAVMRIAIAGFMHESNTFSPLCTDRAAFQAQSLTVGPALLDE